MRILSWNVNGLRAATRKGFKRWFRSSGADVVAVQEVRARPEQLDPTIARPRGWRTHFSVAERPGYSGVGLFTTAASAPHTVETSLGDPELDREGRFLLAHFDDVSVASVYVPNGNGTVLPSGRRSNDRVPYKLAFSQAVWRHLEPAKAAGRAILVVGDFNTAPAAIDLARPRQNIGTSGFLPEEVAEIDRWKASGWVDTFRQQRPDAAEQYSWWSNRSGCRERNVGWRLDLVMASPAAAARVTDAFILPEVMGSDHCPVGVELGPLITSDGS